MVLERGQQGSKLFDNFSAFQHVHEYFADFDVFDESGTYYDPELYYLDPKLNLTLGGILRKVPILYQFQKKNSASSACVQINIPHGMG